MKAAIKADANGRLRASPPWFNRLVEEIANGCTERTRRGPLDQCVPAAVEVVSSVASGDAAAQ
jgi:hypothetical protein